MSPFGRPPRAAARILLAILWSPIPAGFALPPASDDPTGAAESGVAGALLALPEPNLDQVDPAIRGQLEEMRGAVEELTGGGSIDVTGAADAFARLGQLYFLYGLLDAAEAAFANARTLEPDVFDWTYYLGAVRQAQHDPEAAADLERALELRPGHVQTLVRLGRIALELGDLERASRRFEEALAINPDLAAAHEGLGEVASLAGDPRAAAARFETTLALQPEASSVHYRLGTAYRELGDLERAREQLRQRGEGEVRLADPLVDDLGRLATGAGVYIVRGTTAYTRGDLPAAVALYARAVSEDPENLIARQALASALARSGRSEEALAQFLVVLASDPDNSFAHYNVGTLRVAAGRLDEGIGHFQRAVALAPEFTDAHFNLATALEQAGRDDEAEAAYERAVELDPQDPAPRLQRSRVLLRLGRYGDAERELTDLVALDPGNARALFTLAETLEQLGRPAEAAARYRAILELEVPPLERGLTHYRLGIFLSDQGETEAALAELEAAGEALPGRIEPRLARAQVAGRLGEFAEAAAAFDEILGIDPNHDEARFGRAIALLMANRPDEARAHLEASLDRRPESVALEHALARLLATSPSPASRDGERALELAGEVFRREPTVEHAETVAMALAETGEFEQAAQWQRRVIQEASNAGLTGRLETLRRRLALYESGEPCRSPWLEGD